MGAERRPNFQFRMHRYPTYEHRGLAYRCRWMSFCDRDEFGTCCCVWVCLYCFLRLRFVGSGSLRFTFLSPFLTAPFSFLGRGRKYTMSFNGQTSSVSLRCLRARGGRLLLLWYSCHFLHYFLRFYFRLFLFWLMDSSDWIRIR
jgi:hypothetical protein